MAAIREEQARTAEETRKAKEAEDAKAREDEMRARILREVKAELAVEDAAAVKDEKKEEEQAPAAASSLANVDARRQHLSEINTMRDDWLRQINAHLRHFS